MSNFWNKFLWMFLLTGLLHADSGTSGFVFFKQDIGARPLAMGGAFTAIESDLHGLIYNPASIQGVPDKKVSLAYSNHLVDFQSGFIGFSRSLQKNKQLGVGVSYMNYGKMVLTDIMGVQLGEFTPSDLVLTAVYSQALHSILSGGISLKYMHSNLSHYSASAVAADGGLIFRVPSQELTVGFAIRNFGKSIDSFLNYSEKLPLTYRLGFSKKLAHLPLLISSDLIRYHYEKSTRLLGFYWALGGEFTLSDHVFMRWGYHSKGADQKVGTGTDRTSGISFGLGVHLKQFLLDLAYASYGAIGNVTYFSFSAEL